MSPAPLKNSNALSHAEVGQGTLLNESKALESLALSLDKDFDHAVDILANLQGRVITCGMGKSGHIANKIAATLASTGTPAFFVHPSEASHGDLGMITHDDVLIVLSNSGETAEISDVLHFAKRFSIPLISMTSKAKSTLAKFSTVALVLPAHQEACPLGLAPTTSTTMMLALGDALAIALLKQRNFAHHDFKRFHPGGKLGQQLLTVESLMRKSADLPKVPPHTLMSDALVTMSAKGFGSVAVTDDHDILLGILTDGDLRRHMSSQLLNQEVSEIMTSTPLSVTPETLAGEALAIMNDKSVTSLCVTDSDNRLMGMIQMHDCLRTGVA